MKKIINFDFKLMEKMGEVKYLIFSCFLMLFSPMLVLFLPLNEKKKYIAWISAEALSIAFQAIMSYEQAKECWKIKKNLT